MEKVTSGRDYLGEIAPEFARINDDVLFGEVWSREGILSQKQRSMITIAALMGAGILDQSLDGHLETGKKNGITKAEIVEMITQLAFYTGWPKGWAVLSKVMEVYKDEEVAQPMFGLGELIDDPDHFTGRVYEKEIFGFDKPMLLSNVTFAPSCINHWHIHQLGQTLFVISGRGYYQQEGKEAQELKAGDIVEIPGGVKHWHGAAKDSWFTHLATEDYHKGAPSWLEEVDQTMYQNLK